APRAGTCAGGVRAPTATVHYPLAVPGQDRLTAEHEALLPVPRSMVVDGECAQDRGRFLFSVSQVGGLADEVLFLHAQRGHPGLDDVVLGLQLVAVRAIAFLQPAGRPVHPDSTRG